MRILLSAFSCGPGRGSEPGVGWNWVTQISKRHEVWVLTTDEFKTDLEKTTLPKVRVHCIPSFKRWARLRLLPLPGLDWVYYYWWQWKAYRLAERLHREVHFDLAHHVTFVTWRTPSFLCLLPIPLIWGPVGGAGSVPASLRGELGFLGRIFEALRLAGQVVSKWDPFVRLTIRRSAVILGATRDVKEVIPRAHRNKIRPMFCSAMSHTELAEMIPQPSSSEDFLVLFAGLLEPRKAGTLALKAFARMTKNCAGATLVIAGWGPEQGRLEKLAKELGINDRVRFLGGIKRQEVLGWMQAAGVLLFPSLRETCPLVLLEAMATATPIVCLDLGGPGEMVTDQCGIKVQPADPDQVVSDLAAALQKLYADPAMRESMGQAGRQRVLAEFDWDKRGEQMLAVYERAVTGPGEIHRAD